MSVVCLALAEKEAAKKTSQVQVSEEKVKRRRQEEGDNVTEKQKRVKGDGEPEQSLPVGLGSAKKSRGLPSSSRDVGGPSSSPGSSDPSTKLSPVALGTWWKVRRDGASAGHRDTGSGTVSLQVCVRSRGMFLLSGNARACVRISMSSMV